MTLVAEPEAGAYQGIVLAVAHCEFVELGGEAIRKWGAPSGHVLYDLKYLLPRTDADLRL